jgi:hypothetical protein
MQKLILLLALTFSFSAMAAVEPYTPVEALADTNSGPLVFIGKGLLYGSFSVESCLYKNERAYIVHRYCIKPEVGAGDLMVYSFARKQAIKIHAESPQNKKPISETDPRDYPAQFWYVALSLMPEDFSPDLTFEQFAAYYEKNARQYPPNCFVSARFSECNGSLVEYEAWLPVATQFRNAPPAQWQQTLVLLKNSVR